MTNSDIQKNSPVTLPEISERLSLTKELEKLPRPSLDVLKTTLAKELHGAVLEEPAAEHVYSYGLAVGYDSQCSPLAVFNRDIAKYMMYVRVSWVLPYATIQWRVQTANREWQGVAEETLPALLVGATLCTKQILENLGYRLLFGDILQQVLPCELSDLDDSPATIFEVLFSAID